MEKEKRDWGYIFFSIRAYIALFLLFLIGTCGPGFIRQYKKNKEMELIHYGGSVKEANKAIDLRNQKIIELQKAVDTVLKSNPSMYVFTNDTTALDSVILYPNINFDVFEPPTFIGNPVIQSNNRIVEEVDSFLQNKDSMSWYYVQLKKNNHTLNVKRYQPYNDSLKFKVITYFKPTKEYDERPIMKNRHKYAHLYGKKKDSFETRNFYFRESNLKNIKKQYKYRSAILRPYYKYLYDDTFLFYFVCYNKNITKTEFKTYVDLILQGSLSGLDCSNCNIVELKTIIVKGLEL